MCLQQDLNGWDGKSSSDIEKIHQRHRDSQRYSARLVELMRDENLQTGASWLLKRHLETGDKLALAEITALLTLLPDFGHWQTKLHILQCLPFFTIDKSVKPTVENFLRECLVDSNKFVRAWAYNGFNELSHQYPEYREETEEFLAMAMRDEAPSVKARIRNMVKPAS